MNDDKVQMRNDNETAVFGTVSGSVYEVDLDASRFRRLQGTDAGAGAKYGQWTKYGAIVVSAEPAMGVLFVLDESGRGLRTSAVTTGHHALLWAARGVDLETN